MSTGTVQPDGYGELLPRLKAEVRDAQLRAHRVVNTELLRLYWAIGAAILERQDAEGWGTRVIRRLGDDLRAEFPHMRGFSGRNLQYMASAARAVTETISPTGSAPAAAGKHRAVATALPLPPRPASS